MDGEFEKTIDMLSGLLKKRTSSFEIFLFNSKGVNVEAKDGRIDAYRLRDINGVGLRTVKDAMPGFGFSSVFTPSSLKDMVDATLLGSSGATPDGFLSFPLKETPSETVTLDVFDPSFDAASEDEKIKNALRIEESAFAYDKRIKRVRKASYGETRVHSHTVNSNGVDVGFEGTFFSGGVSAVAEEGEESQIGWEVGMGHKRKDVLSEAIGQGAARRAVEMLGARPIKSRQCLCIFENIVVIEFLSSLSASFFADNAAKNKSMLIGMKGKKVASPFVNLFDDGVMPSGWASSLYDSEGVPRRKTPLLMEGVLEGFLYDTYWAKREGLGSTGNAVRGGFKAHPSIGITNLYMEKGGKTLEELFKEMNDGLFINDIMGAHTIDSVSGDFSLGASGLWIEGGKPIYPVRGIAIAGNLLELFSKVSSVASDLRFIGSIGAPSLLFEGLDISGT